MTQPSPRDITQMLIYWNNGDRESLDRLDARGLYGFIEVWLTTVKDDLNMAKAWLAP